VKKTILITGGAGFIGSNLLNYLVPKYPEYQFINIDKLTYAGNLKNLTAIADALNYCFYKIDISDAHSINKLFYDHKIDTVLHLAAESHVDRSIIDPMTFVHTNVIGTVHLLHAARASWQKNNFKDNLFYHISTDEVYGSLGENGLFTEKTPYDPRSPYSASKAASDHFVRAYHHTYGLPIVLSNCSNNYGPYQFPEKLIPLFIHNMKNNIALPVYGKGDNTRDWLYVEDHCRAIDTIMTKGKIGETYNIGGFNEWKNIDLILHLCKVMDDKLNRVSGTTAQLIQFVQDRPGHDKRYAIDATKIKNELGWKPYYTFEQAIIRTVDWYLENESWLEDILNGTYYKYYEQQYGKN